MASFQTCTPFMGESLALEVALQLGLAEAASLAVACRAIVDTVRCVALQASAKNESAAKDLVCGILGIKLRSGQKRYSLERPDGKNILAMAAAAGRPDVVRWLLGSPYFAKMVNVPDSSGACALHYAALEGQHHTCDVLIKFSADVNCADSTGIRPLHLAAEGGHLETCMVLADHEADINTCNKEDVTPLLLAVEERQLEVCRFLARRGANPLSSSTHGRTPLAVAREAGDYEFASALEAALWPQRRKQSTKLVLGPDQLEIMRRATQLR